MSDPTDAIRDILGFPNAPVTPIRPHSDGTLNLRFTDAHDDDYQAAGDDLRDRDDTWRPDPKDLA